MIASAESTAPRNDLAAAFAAVRVHLGLVALLFALAALGWWWTANEMQGMDDGLCHSVRIGDVIDFEIEDIVPFGVETGEPIRFQGMFHPAGSDLTMAEAKHTRINAFGIEYEGKTGLSTSEFSSAA